MCFAQKGPKASAPSGQDRSVGCELSVGRSETGEGTTRFQCCAGGAERPLDGDVVPAGPCSRWALEEAGEEAPWAAGAGGKALPAICKTLAGAMGNFCLTSAGVINRCPEA